MCRVHTGEVASFPCLWRLSCCRGSLSTESDVGDVRAGGGHVPQHNIVLTSNGTTCHGVGHAGGVRVCLGFPEQSIRWPFR